MPFVPHIYVQPWDVVWFWGCIALPEQRAARQLAIVSGTPFPYAVADVVDLEFLSFSPLWWERRLAAWRANWQVTEDEVELGESTVRVYTTDAAWAGLLRECILADGCAPGDSDCASRPGYSP